MAINKPALPYVKICGITNREDALLAAKLGAHALGFNFSQEKSLRQITPAQAKTIIAALPPFVTTVGIFTDIAEAEILATLTEVPLQVLQFHGSETDAECTRYHKPYIKALAMKPDTDIHNLIAQYPHASAILLDTYHPQKFGATGLTFDWKTIPANINKPIILAGGLSATNVAQAIRVAKPYAVDVCSGVEASIGKKDPNKLMAFFNEVQHAFDTQN